MTPSRSSRWYGSAGLLTGLLVVFLTAGACSPGTPIPGEAGPPAPIAFTDVTVLPMAGGQRLLTHQTVLVRDGEIERISPAAEVAIPEDARQVDGAGSFLLPGLADMHVHLERFPGPEVLKLFLASGVTTVRSMDGRPRILEYREAVEEERLAGPHIYTAGPILEGRDPFWDDTRVVGSPAEARAAVREQAAAGYDFVKVYHTLGADAFRAVVEAAGTQELSIAGHVPNQVGLAEFLRSRVASVEHLQGYDDAIETDDSPYRGRFHWSKLYLGMPADTGKIRSVASRTAAAGVWNCPTLVQQEKIAPYREMVRWYDSASLQYLPDAVKAQWNPENFPTEVRGQLESLDEEDLEVLARGQANRHRLLRALHQEGADLLVGTDTPQPFVLPGSSMLEEIENFSGAGLSRYDALRAATAAAGRFAQTELGEGQTFGVIEPGVRADLLLLAGNPLESLENLSRVQAVTVSGRLYERHRLEALRSEVAERYGG